MAKPHAPAAQPSVAFPRLAFVAFATALAGAAGTGGCGSNSTLPPVPDSGGTHPGDGGTGSHPDAHADATGTNDSGGTKDGGGTTGDSGADSGADTGADTGAVCAKHPPAGFTQALVSTGVTGVLTGSGGARASAMVLDENDDPMFAFSSADSNASWSVQFFRWDHCAGAFTTPITVDTVYPGALEDVSIAYDPTTKEVGIAYIKPDTDNNWEDSWDEVWLGTMKTPATTFTVQRLTSGSTDDNSTSSPSIAMTNGHIYIALGDGPYLFSFPGLILFLSSTTTPSYPNSNAPAEDDAGPGDAAIKPVTDAGADAGPVPPHFFSYEAIPFAGGFEGFATPLQAGMSAASASVRVAVDSTGTPGVAAFQPGASYSKQVLFWRPGKQAVSAYTFVVDNGVDLSLAFDGVKPRIAGHMVSPAVDAGEVAPDSLTFLSSDDGITWNPKVNLPSNGGTLGTSFSSALALDGMGHASVVSDINGRTGNDAGCSGNPYIATSADENDGGAVWAACGANTNDTLKYGSYSVSASYGASRLKGTLTASFVTNAIAVDAGANQAGIIYWQAQ